MNQIESRHRRIRTAIPNPETLSVLKTLEEFEPLSMHSDLPVVWDHARGYQVYDKSGNCWIDFTSTIFVANVGHSHPKVVSAICETATKDLLNAYYYPTELRAKLAQKLVEMSGHGMEQVLFLSTGAETTEVANKIIVQYGRKTRPSKDVVIAFEGSFHGKTMGAQTLGGKPSGKAWIGHLHPRIHHLPYPYPWVLEKNRLTGAEFFHQSLNALTEKGIELEDIAGFLAEPYQGWCAIFFPKDYVLAMRDWASRHQALLAFDEVQAGFGRTGKLFGFEHFGVKPDIICCAKALSASIPVSAVISSKELLGLDGSLNSTHGGNPIGMAASLAVLNVLEEENLIAESARKGKLLQREIESWSHSFPAFLTENHGNGLMRAAFVVNPKTKELDPSLADKIVNKAFAKGVLSIRTGCGTLKFGPPLMIPDEALLEGLNVIKEAIAESIAETE